MKVLFVVCLALGTIQLVGCQGASRQEIVRSSVDHALAGEVYRHLRDGMVRDGRAIGVTVNGGVVTLHGTVSDGAAWAQAASIAENVPGVDKVINELGQ